MVKIRINRRALYSSGQTGIAGATQIQGRELSYNNLVDLDAAWQLIAEFDRARRGHRQTHQSLRLRRSFLPMQPALRSWKVTGARSRPIPFPPTVEFWPSIARWTMKRRRGREDLHRSDCRAGVLGRSAADPGRAKKSARAACRRGAPGLVVKSISGGFLAQTPDVGPPRFARKHR